jgi:hypothetical protein
VKTWTFLQCSGQRAKECHFETIKYPGDAERGNNEDMKATKWKAIEPSGNCRFNNGPDFDFVGAR